MANIFEMTEEKKRLHDEWIASRPVVIQEMLRKYPPNKLYLMKTTGQRVTIYSYSENNTVTVNITGKYNLIDFERQVFGVAASDLEECDLPREGEKLGVLMSSDETFNFINGERAKNGLPPLTKESYKRMDSH